MDDPQADDDLSLTPNRMVALPSVSGHAAVFVCGSYPGFILKSAQSTAKFHRLAGESVRSVCQFNVNNGVQDGFLYYDSQVLRVKICLIAGCNTDLSTTSRVYVSWKVVYTAHSTRKGYFACRIL